MISLIYSIISLIYSMISHILIIIPKTKKFDCFGWGYMTSLFRSCEIDRSQGKLF